MEASGAVRPVYGSLGVKRLIFQFPLSDFLAKLSVEFFVSVMLIISPTRLRFQDLIIQLTSNKSTSYEEYHRSGFSSLQLLYVVSNSITFPSLAVLHLRWKQELSPKRRYLSTKPAHCHSPEESQYLTTHHSNILQCDRIWKKLASHFCKVLSQSSDNLPHLSYHIVYCE